MYENCVGREYVMTQFLILERRYAFEIMEIITQF